MLFWFVLLLHRQKAATRLGVIVDFVSVNDEDVAGRSISLLKYLFVDVVLL